MRLVAAKWPMPLLKHSHWISPTQLFDEADVVFARWTRLDHIGRNVVCAKRWHRVAYVGPSIAKHFLSIGRGSKMTSMICCAWCAKKKQKKCTRRQRPSVSTGSREQRARERAHIATGIAGWPHPKHPPFRHAPPKATPMCAPPNAAGSAKQAPPKATALSSGPTQCDRLFWMPHPM